MMDESTEAAAMLQRAEEVSRGVRTRGRRFAAFLVAFGLFWVGVVVAVPLARGLWAIPFFVLLLLVTVVGRRYNQRQQVAALDTGRTIVPVVVWTLVSYVVVVLVVGPRWLEHAALGWWAVAGVVVALGLFVEAGRVWWSNRG